MTASLRRIKKARYFTLPLLALIVLVSFAADPGVIETLLKKLQQYHADRPQEKIYIHHDKPFYAAGDNLWFKAYVVEASLHHLDSQSRVVYVELADKNKTIFARKMLFAAGGVTFGDFVLPDTLQEGNYVIRAYTNYMKNFGEDFFFTKEFSVLNPLLGSTTGTEKLGRDSVDLQFFAEGGNFVACGFNRLAFKAVSPDGRGINVEGTIVDEKNAVVANFKSQHLGMGSVKISPVAGKQYFARITKPYSINRSYPLPQVQSKGYTLQVDAAGKNIKVIVFTNMDKPASGDHALNIIVQSRGQAYYAAPGKFTNNGFYTLIPKSKFPDGISQITVFDAEGRPVAERLVHQDNHETIKLAVETDTTLYGKRKMVTVLADALYRNGSPATGSFSISVYDEALIKNQDEYPLTITNYLSLKSDLKGYIENPGYYFKDSLVETKRNLDLLLMTQGWRRFTWNDVLQHKPGAPQFRHEGGIPISGQVLKVAGKRPPLGSILKVMTMDGRLVRLRPDSSGRFYTDSLLYYDSTTLVFQTENAKGKRQPYKFLPDPMTLPPAYTHKMMPFIPFDAGQYLEQQADEKLIVKSSEVKVLAEAKVTAKREVDPRLLGGNAGRVLDVKKLHGETYSNVFQMMQSRLPGVWVTSAGSSYQVTVRGKAPIFLMDGRVSDVDMVGMVSPADVEYIEVLPNSALYGGSAINVILRKGATLREESIGVNRMKYPGFYQAKEFYSPQYDKPDNRHYLEDKRTTLFWEPMLVTDQAGRAAIAFYTADVASRYRIVIEGITNDGYPGTATTTFEVK
ncbi:MAG TPA: Plug domain-containing protein [Cyclobacteriaceae bacterium]|nr:Plug domain-containing protein [Cyclobacteriaceae bacterium]HMV91159.1 Plug domain-containing protein [Cyclobacteriaceae bacterium]HMX01956.1 Plug domain-containing protein [Cyclobacteriaceae bacterium]HMX51943.1 Plug domain-containing protein [Cyclobacteriaceae bacterium]HMY94779.1 Plug domain-containing protein [Cyclobacteriaceae bacterium]